MKDDLDNAASGVLDQITATPKGEIMSSELYNALAFAASVIKCGEPWTDQCEKVIGGALDSYRKQQADVGATGEQESALSRGIKLARGGEAPPPPFQGFK